MKIDKLISMTDFVMDANEKMAKREDEQFDATLDRRGKLIGAIFNYAKFLSRPLTFDMFVPVREDGVILKGKPLSPAPDSEWVRWENEEFEFYKAREKILFEGFELNVRAGEDGNYQSIKLKGVDFHPMWNNGETGWRPGLGIRTIEQLIVASLKLTDTALNQIYK